MIYGIGVDVLEVERITHTLERFGERFTAHLLLPAEAAQLKLTQRPARFIAMRFAAKEAFSKAIGIGMRMPMTWRAMELLNLPSGEPTPVCHGELARWLGERGITVRVSVSDEHNYAVAFAIAETGAGGGDGRVPSPA